MSIDHELTFCADAAGWMNQELAARPELAFGKVQIEQSTRGAKTRRDLTIYDRAGGMAITGEVKLPYGPDGQTPFNEKLVEEAHVKAAKAGARFFVTFNVNRIVIWQTDDPGKRLFERAIHEQVVGRVRDSEDLVNPEFQQQIRRGLLQFLERASDAYRGVLPLSRRPLDAFFITLLEAGLDRPILTSLAGMIAKYRRDGKFRIRLNEWMRDVQGWPISDDELVQRDTLERAAKFSCYVLVNKVVFYTAMRRRFPKLKAVRVASSVTEAKVLQEWLYALFADAMKASRDYETVFDGDFGDQLPFLSDHVVPAWRDLFQSIDRFDFTQLNFDVIGPIFERLIDPEERHRYGQHYTKPEIVDLIESFCIRKPDAVVLDPACGGGTFLVRAYSRKKFLAQRARVALPHERLLNQLYAIDMSAYATHLTTINLATRDLIDERNYPLVAQSDFFDVEPNKPVFHIPMVAGAGGKQFQPVFIRPVDAIVGNPPYVRQEEISKPPTATIKERERLTARTSAQIKAAAKEYKRKLKELAEQAAPGIDTSGRSDLHVYFWPHALRLLKPDGYFGFLTSSGWLDVEYGFRLQEFLLKHFAILAIFESQVEPWFTGARVTTCATLLRREPDEAKRNVNLVRFVQLRSKLSDILPSDQMEEERQLAIEALRDRIEAIVANCVEPHWRVRVVNQETLHQLGCRTAIAPVAGESGDAEIEGESEAESKRKDLNGEDLNKPRYFGSKWGVHLRAPDLFFEIQDRYGDRLVPLGELATIRFGVKTGCDRFFFVRDITDACLARTPSAKEFRSLYGIQPFQTDKLRVIKTGDGTVHPIEMEFLEPEVHNLMEISGVFGIRIKPEELTRQVLVCNKPKSQLKRTCVLKYIEWGEKEGYNRATTIKQRIARDRDWYDLVKVSRGALFWPKAQQYRHLVPLNDKRLICNCNLYDLYPREDVDEKVLCGILNATLSAMYKHVYGRWAGTEGNLKTEIVDVKMMPVPDARKASPEVARRITEAVERMAARPTRNLSDELHDPSRNALDDAVLELLGESDFRVRLKLRDDLYREMAAMHGAIRGKELQALRNKRVSKLNGTMTVEELADEIWNRLEPSLLRRFPEDFIGPDEPVESVELVEGRCRIYAHPLMQTASVQIDGRHIELGDERRAMLVKAIFDSGRRGQVPIPRSPEVCETVRRKYLEYHEQVTAEFTTQVAERTANEKTQARVMGILQQRLTALAVQQESEG